MDMLDPHYRAVILGARRETARAEAAEARLAEAERLLGALVLPDFDYGYGWLGLLGECTHCADDDEPGHKEDCPVAQARAFLATK